MSHSFYPLEVLALLFYSILLITLCKSYYNNNTLLIFVFGVTTGMLIIFELGLYLSDGD